MNLTAEHIDTIRWAYKNPDIDALADMAKRTLAAEAKVVEIDTENGLLKEKLTAARNELAALKNAGEPHDIAEFYKDEPVAAPDLVERLSNIRKWLDDVYEGGTDSQKLDEAIAKYNELAAALAEREKDAERYRARRDSDWCAYDEYCDAIMPRDGSAIRQNSEQFIAQYDQDSDFMLEDCHGDYIVGPDAAIDALRSRS